MSIRFYKDDIQITLRDTFQHTIIYIMHYRYQIISLEFCIPIVASITCYKHSFLDYSTFTSQPFAITDQTRIISFQGLIRQGSIVMNQEKLQDCFDDPVRIDLESENSNGEKILIGSAFLPLFFQLIQSCISSGKVKSFHEYVYIESRYKIHSRTIIGKIRVKFEVSTGNLAEISLVQREYLLKNRRLLNQLKYSRQYKMREQVYQVKEQAKRGSNNFREQKQGTEEYYKQYITSLHQENSVLRFQNIQLKNKYQKLIFESGSSIALQHVMLLRSYQAQKSILVHQDQASKIVTNQLQKSIQEKDGLISRQRDRIDELERLCKQLERKLLDMTD